MVRSLGLTSLVKCNKQAVKDDWWCNIFKREQKHHQNQKQQKEQTNKNQPTNMVKSMQGPIFQDRKTTRHHRCPAVRDVE